MEINFKPNTKQWEAWVHLVDNEETKEVLYGGAAGGGKSYLGCAWLIWSCLAYPESRWVLARSKLGDIRKTTMVTFKRVCKDFGLENGSDFHYHDISSEIKFFNGSVILLRELYSKPSDPDFDSLGSSEYTGAWVDEASQISGKARDVLSSRIRWNTSNYYTHPITGKKVVLGKILLTSNPSKNFLYHDFYKPKVEGKLRKDRAFVQAYVQDNPYTASEDYINRLKSMDKVSRERLLNGNWEYNSDPSSLMEYDRILAIFENYHIETENGTKRSNGEEDKGNYISCDVARLGSDNTVILVWKGLKIVNQVKLTKATTDITAKTIRELQVKHSVPVGQVVIDCDGIGGGVVDQLKGSYSFLNGGKVINGENFNHLKSQCYFKLAELVNTNDIWFDIDDNEIQLQVIAELEQVKRGDVDGDGKLKVVSKAEMKKNLNEKSPDWSDAMMMRMVFSLKPVRNFAETYSFRFRKQ